MQIWSLFLNGKAGGCFSFIEMFYFTCSLFCAFLHDSVKSFIIKLHGLVLLIAYFSETIKLRGNSDLFGRAWTLRTHPKRWCWMFYKVILYSLKIAGCFTDVWCFLFFPLKISSLVLTNLLHHINAISWKGMEQMQGRRREAIILAIFSLHHLIKKQCKVTK